MKVHVVFCNIFLRIKHISPLKSNKRKSHHFLYNYLYIKIVLLSLPYSLYADYVFYSLCPEGFLLVHRETNTENIETPNQT